MGDLAATMSGLDVGAGDVAAAFGSAQDPGQARQTQQEPAQTPQQTPQEPVQGQEPQQPAEPAPGQPMGQQGQEPQQPAQGQAQGQQPQAQEPQPEPQPEPQQPFNPSDYGFDSQEALADALDDLADAVDIAGDRATLLKIVKEYKAQGPEQPRQDPGQPDQSDDFWDDLYSEPGQDGGTPPEPGSIEAENRMLKQRLAQLESTTRTREQEAAQMERYEAIADATLDRIGITDDNAREVFKMFVGINNPVEEVDLGSRASIRKAVTGAATRLQEFIQGIKKAAVEEYVAGKAGMIPGTQGGQSGQRAQAAQQANGQRQQAQQPGQQTPTATQNPPQNPLTRGLSGDQALIEDAFSKANSELLEVMVSAVNTE